MRQIVERHTAERHDVKGLASDARERGDCVRFRLLYYLALVLVTAFMAGLIDEHPPSS